MSVGREQATGARTARDVLRLSTAYLGERGCETARLDAEHLVAKALGVSRVGLYADLDRPMTGAELEACRELVARRGRREPLQYVLGEWGFRRLTLTVDRRGLIPRPETELLVERALARLDGTDEPRVLDVGTGSGAIALAIADERPGTRVTAVDVSPEALALAAENARRTRLVVELLACDVLAGLPAGPWDVVVSNPPYVGAAELAALAPEVRDWEPEAALRDRGQTEAVVRGAAETLLPGGWLVLETHADGAADVVVALEAAGLVDVSVTRDLAGRDRVVEGARPR